MVQNNMPFVCIACGNNITQRRIDKSNNYCHPCHEFWVANHSFPSEGTEKVKATRLAADRSKARANRLQS